MEKSSQSYPNRLLELLHPLDLDRLRQHLEPVVLEYRQSLYEANEPITSVYFPIDGVVSLVNTMADGSTSEVGTIDQNGVRPLEAVFPVSGVPKHSFSRRGRYHPHPDERPRDITPGTSHDALGGTYYWGASLELQTPLYFLPKDAGIKVAAFADAGSLWNYTGPTVFPATGEVISGNFCPTFGPGIPNATPCAIDNAMHVRSSVGIGLIWESPFGPLRFDYAFPLSKEPYDRIQQFRFGGGTKF